MTFAFIFIPFQCKVVIDEKGFYLWEMTDKYNDGINNQQPATATTE